MHAIGRLREDQHAAQLSIQVCVAIGKADKNFSEPKKQ